MKGHWIKETVPGAPEDWQVMYHVGTRAYETIWLRLATCRGPEAEAKADAILLDHALAELAREFGGKMAQNYADVGSEFYARSWEEGWFRRYQRVLDGTQQDLTDATDDPAMPVTEGPGEEPEETR